ncbi:MAG: alpha/beta hydrolase [Actinomycetota bacterium]
MTPIDVTITTDGIDLAGHLRIPDGVAGPAPAVVLTGPFTGTKEQVVAVYAEKLTAAGSVTLVFDHRNFGASGGHRRHHEDSAGKLADLLAATSFLAEHPAVDAERLGCVGICLGGGYALKHSAFDPRIKALGLVAAAFNDPRAMREGMGADGYRDTMGFFAGVNQAEVAGGDVDYIKAVTDVDGEDAGMPGAEPFAYYGTDRSASPVWENRITRSSIRELLTFDAAIGADFIAPTPTVIVHGRTDDFCSPDAAAAIHERIQGTKDMLWLDTTNHIDLYDVPEYVDPAAERVVAWMGEHL